MILIVRPFLPLAVVGFICRENATAGTGKADLRAELGETLRAHSDFDLKVSVSIRRVQKSNPFLSDTTNRDERNKPPHAKPAGDIIMGVNGNRVFLR